MNDNAKRWVKALRSGEYQQTVKRLHRITDGVDSFCCLGIACKLYAEDHDITTVIQANTFEDDAVAYASYAAILPHQVQYWLGLNDRAGGFGYETLADRNDRGATFVEIADIIESEPPGLFMEESNG